VTKVSREFPSKRHLHLAYYWYLVLLAEELLSQVSNYEFKNQSSAVVSDGKSSFNSKSENHKAQIHKEWIRGSSSCANPFLFDFIIYFIL